MGVTVRWDEHVKDTLTYQYTGSWTWEEYQQAALHARDLASSVEGPVKVIGDFSETHLLPTHALTSFRKSMATTPITFSVAVIVTRAAFMRTMIEVFRRLYTRMGDRLLVAHSLDEARQMLADPLRHPDMRGEAGPLDAAGNEDHAEPT